MILSINATLRAILVVSAVVVLFIIITIINLKTKRPKIEDNKDCETCLNRDGCPIILKEEEKKEDSGEDNK